MGWLVSACRRSMDGVGTAAISSLRNFISKTSQAKVRLQSYADGLVDGLVVGFSDGTGGIWRFDVCISTPVASVWTLCKAQSTSPRLQHCDGARRLSMPC